MSVLAATLGLPVDFDHGGKTYKVSPVDVEIVGLFETWLEGRALAAIQRHAPDPASPERASPGRLLPGEWMAHQEVWQRDVACGMYEWESPAAISARYSTAGQKYLAFLQLARQSKGVTLQLVDAIWKDPEALQRLRAAQAQVASPNSGGAGASLSPAPPSPGPSGEPEEAPPSSPSTSPGEVKAG